QVLGQLDGGPPVRAPPTQQPHIPSDACHVGVERDYQPRRIDRRPRPGVELIATAHPPEEETQPLRAPAFLRTGEPVRDAFGRASRRERERAAAERRQRIGDVATGVADCEERLDRSAVTNDSTEDVQGRSSVSLTEPAMPPASKPRKVTR